MTDKDCCRCKGLQEIFCWKRQKGQQKLIKGEKTLKDP